MFEGVTKEGMTYLLNMETRRDKFQKHTRVLFYIKYVPHDGN